MSYDAILKRLENMRLVASGDSPKLRTALIRVGSVLEAEMKLNIVRHKMVNTGRLLNSIRYEVKAMGDKTQLTVGSFGVEYAAINEYGGKLTSRQIRAMFASFRGRAKRAGKGIVRVYGDGSGYHRARPYMRPAIAKHRNFMLDVLREAYNV
jgi:phage gpG-like protein